MLDDVIYQCKMMSHMRFSLTIGGEFSAMAESRKKLKPSNVFSLFIVC